MLRNMKETRALINSMDSTYDGDVFDGQGGLKNCKILLQTFSRATNVVPDSSMFAKVLYQT